VWGLLRYAHQEGTNSQITPCFTIGAAQVYWMSHPFVFCVFSYSLEWNRLLENDSHICDPLYEFTQFRQQLYLACASHEMCRASRWWLREYSTSNGKT